MRGPADPRQHLAAALQYVPTCLLAYLGGDWIGQAMYGHSATIGALWCAISGMAVLQPGLQQTLQAARGQLVGTFAGAVVAAIYLALWPFSAIGMALCAGLTVLLCRCSHVADDGRLAAATVAVTMVVSSQHPQLAPWANAGLRFLESCVGVAAGLGVMAVSQWAGRSSPD